MFELASDGPASKQECGVSETSTELAAFASALDGKTSHYENTWLSLQRMMDKYDVPMLRTVLLLSAREALARDPLFAFSAAAILSDRTLQQEAEISCLGADMSAIKKKIWLQAPEVERLRLRLFDAQAHKIALETLSSGCAGPEYGTPAAHANKCPSIPGDRQTAYGDALLLILNRTHRGGISRTVSDVELLDFPNNHPLHSWCSECKEHLRNRLGLLAERWRDQLL
ncbi:hypothetical protein BMF94_1615 [Rhodotorula taiwanensis]|uniref:Uncharacterized protein n=1 Tax=Rhodotorula taiwanensis TaxID=741276 RepID=A0A2S5BEP5_9BASI|nr:hypothetical protein BMF94_1615 [Rhodotorula taiwanensis]